MARERAAVLIAAAVISVPIAVWAAWPRPPSVDAPPQASYDLCPPAPGQPLVSLAFDSRHYSPERGASYTTYHDRFLAYEPADGATVARVALGTHRENARAYCLAATGDDVWLWTHADGFHVREARTGQIRRTQADLLAGISAPADQIRRILPETGFRHLAVQTKDGRTTRIEIGGGGGAPVAVARPRALTNLSADAAKTSAGVLDVRGRPRAEILLAGAPLGRTDWLEPWLLVHPPTGTLEWPGPPSLIVCEPLEMNGAAYQLTRIGLDGTIQWTYRPSTGSARQVHDCKWWASDDGAHLVLLTEQSGMVGIDARTGRETFRRVQ